MNLTVNDGVALVHDQISEIARLREVNAELRAALQECERLLCSDFAIPNTSEGRRAMVAMNNARVAIAKENHENSD